jgi:hypothetical protein
MTQDGEDHGGMLQPMDLERFQSLAERYGADLRRWPDGEREAAHACCAAHAAASARILAAEAELDAWLDADQAVAPSVRLRELILASAPKPRRVPRIAGIDFGYWLSGAGLAAAAAAGLAIGLASPNVAKVRQAEALSLGAVEPATEAGVERPSS